MPSIIVDDKDTQLSYIDSGVPARAAGSFLLPRYVTIFAIHGFQFTHQSFERVMAHASDANIRFVAISRRDYPGSTPLSSEDLAALSSDRDEEKQAFVRARGLEIMNFIDNFIEQNSLLPITGDGMAGGFALLGYGIGGLFALAAVANLDTLPASFQKRWCTHMRALLLHEPLTVSIGKPRLPAGWRPSDFPSFMLEKKWQSAYFKQWDLNARYKSIYSYDVNPSIARLPVVETMSEEEVALAFRDHSLTSDMPFFVSCGPQIQASYEKACFDEDIRGLMPGKKVWVFTGDVTVPFSLPGFWAMEDDNSAHGGGFIDFRIVHGVNHYVHWTDPALTLKLYVDAMKLNR